MWCKITALNLSFLIYKMGVNIFACRVTPIINYIHIHAIKYIVLDWVAGKGPIMLAGPAGSGFGMLNPTQTLTQCACILPNQFIESQFQNLQKWGVGGNCVCVCLYETFEIRNLLINIKCLGKKRCHSDINDYSSFPPVLLTKSTNCNISL